MSKKTEGVFVNNLGIENYNHKNLKTDIKGCNNKDSICVELDSTVVDNSPNIGITPIGIDTGVVVKIPVVLAELTVSFNVGANIRLPEPALEVKNIKKRLKITQCSLLQPTNILFIKGYIRKSIDYTTAVCSNREGVCGDLHHCTIDVPFQFSTPVNYTVEPAPLALNSSSEFEYYKVSELPREYFPEKDNLLAGDLSEYNQFRTENFNEMPYCDLISANIFEFDEFVGNRTHYHNMPFEEKLFSHIEERMVIELRLKLLQKRQVAIPPVIAGITALNE